MARVTFTIDDETAAELARLHSRIDQLRERLVEGGLEMPVEDGKLMPHVLKSLEDLGPGASSSAIVRGALVTYLASLRELERTFELELGYAALAADEERDAIVDAMSRRAPERWADES